MAADAEFVTAPSTPDTLEIVVERRLRQHDGGGDGGSSSSTPTMTIFRVPGHVRDANSDLYEPRLVSIGPYYRGRPALRAMEQHKWRYLRELLALNPAASSADCVRAVRAVEHRARRCYSEHTDIFATAAGAGAAVHGGLRGDGVIGDGQSGGGGGNPVPGPDDFGEMLLLDACFVLNFFIKWHNGETDELCDVGWGLPLLQSDLLLLENQIPFFVLEELFRLVSPQAEARHLRSLILPHLRLSKQLSPAEEKRATQAKEIHHLLHLLYEAIVPSAEEMAAPPVHASPGAGAGTTPPRPAPRCAVVVRRLRQMGGRVSKAVSERFAFVRRTMPQLPLTPRWPWMGRLSLLRQATAPACAWLSERTARMGRRTAAAEAEAPPMVVPSVTLLREAGVRFERKASPRHMFDATFDAAAGVVSMPRLEVDHANRPVLVNLAAFEQTTVRGRGGGGGGVTAVNANAKPVSSYAALVSSLVRAGADVEHLQKRGVVDNLLGSDDVAAAEFFQRLGDCSSLDYEDHHLAVMFAELSRYYHSSWQRHKARFLLEHCSSPWAALALIVAGCAFCFALVKFSTTIYGLTHPNCRC